MTKFIFFGRLVQEKGVDMILNVFSQLHIEGIHNWHLDIYGAGPLEDKCIALAKALPKNVSFHGWGDHKLVMSKLPDMDFCLMPSLIIETFGLTALESLRAGAPVIGFKKGGIEPFVSDALNISAHEGMNDTEKLFSLIMNLLSGKTNKQSLMPQGVDLSNYTPDAWLKNFQQIAGSAKRILLVSDFIKIIGGVENYIRDVKDLLEEHGYEVELWGSDKKNSFAGLFKTIFNISARLGLRKKIRTFKPNLVWTHSVIRELGRLPLTAIPKKTKSMMMIHDMGYFFPYPSSLIDCKSVPKDASLRSRIISAQTNNPLKRILLTLKRFSLKTIKKTLNHNDSMIYLAPSEFMIPFIEQQWVGKDNKTVVLSHFVK